MEGQGQCYLYETNIINCIGKRTMNQKCYFSLVLLLGLFIGCGQLPSAKNQGKYASFNPGEIWEDDQGVHINAHGGGVLFHEGTYYWFGEHKGEETNAALVGVTCYSSTDLYNWKNEGVALPVSEDPDSPIVKGSTIERPKVIYNAKTGKFVMYFHLELKGRGYDAARLLTADQIMGPWTLHPNPARGDDAELTFHSQSTFIIPLQGKKDAFIFMADRWRPANPIDGRYIWLPVLFEDGLPLLKWFDEWDLTIFDELTPDSSAPEEIEGYSLVWHDEFNRDGTPDPAVWSFEEGFVRNHELQWYQQENALCRDGRLIITARREKKNNPLFGAGSND